MKSLISITIIMFISTSVLAEVHQRIYRFTCNTLGYVGKNEVSDSYRFSINSTLAPKRSLCGSSMQECHESGYREYFNCQKENEETKCYNHPVIFTKHCSTTGGLLKTTFQTRVGIVKNVDGQDLLTMSVRINRKDSKRIWITKPIAISLDNFSGYLEYKRGRKYFNIDCKVILLDNEDTEYDHHYDFPPSTHEEKLDLCE